MVYEILYQSKHREMNPFIGQEIQKQQHKISVYKSYLESKTFPR